MKNKQPKKRHHFLPESYLDGFLAEKKLHSFDREKIEYRSNVPKKLAHRRYYYRSERGDGTTDARLEDELGELEGHAKALIRKLGSFQELSQEERESLALFVAFFMYRTPQFEDDVERSLTPLIENIGRPLLSDKESAARFIAELDANGKNSSKTTADELVKAGSETNIKILRNASLSMIPSLALSASNYLRQQDWMIMHAPEGCPFITCDAPFVILPPNDRGQRLPKWGGVGIATHGARKIIPLSRQLLLMSLDYGGRMTHVQIQGDQVSLFNSALALSSTRFVYSGTRSHLESVVSNSDLKNCPKYERVTIS